MDQFLRNTRAVLSNAFSAGAAAGGVTVSAVNEAGVTVVSGSATQDGTNLSLYTFQIPPQSSLMRGTATWSGTWGGSAQSVETQWEVVGAQLFTVSEARGFRANADGGEDLSDTNKYSDAMIRETRDRIADAFQRVCGVPFFPRYEREVFDGLGRRRLWLPWKRPLRLISVTVGGVALTAPELAAVYLYVTGRIEREAGWASGFKNIIVEWERGYKYVPGDIKRAALALAQYDIVNSEITDRMVMFANELGTVRLSTPDKFHPTGIPLVDSVLWQLDERERHFVAIRG